MQVIYVAVPAYGEGVVESRLMVARKVVVAGLKYWVWFQ